MKMLSLFSGVGGIDLAAQWAGIQTAAFCEIEPFCRKILHQHWPDIPIFGDVHKLNKEVLQNAGIRDVDIVAGGFPCQPFSRAGKQRGISDERYLWPEMLRITNEIRPTWLIGENVENAVRIVLDDIIDSLEAINYKTQAFVISAKCSGAYFEGKRTFIVATPYDRSAIMRMDKQFQADAKIKGRGNHIRRRAEKLNTGKRRTLESRPYGVADGVPNRVDRIKALGNAVRPQQIYPIFKAIADLEGD
jgi:DNA (cytosine-5)-methyltransferase 1